MASYQLRSLPIEGRVKQSNAHQKGNPAPFDPSVGFRATAMNVYLMACDLLSVTNDQRRAVEMFDDYAEV